MIRRHGIRRHGKGSAACTAQDRGTAHEQGLALVTCLLALTVLSLIGSTAILTASIDLKISRNYKLSEQGFYQGQAGIEEARARLAGTPSTNPNLISDPRATPNPLWSAYILTSNAWSASADPDYSGDYTNYIPTPGFPTATAVSVNSLQNTLPYFVKITHKTEYHVERAGHDPSHPHYLDDDGSTTGSHTTSTPGNVIHYGYYPATAATPVQFTSATPPAATRPVKLITAYARTQTGLKVFEVEVVRRVGPKVVAPLYAKGNITINGSAGFMSGNDHCDEAAPLPPVYMKDPATITGNPDPTYEGTPAAPEQGPLDVDIQAYVDELKSGAMVLTEDQNGEDFGSASNYVTIYSNTANPYNVNGLKIQNGTGYGTLLVDGDLVLGGGFDWNGVILVTGMITFNGGGDQIKILGGIFAHQVVDVSGHVDARYDSCHVTNSFLAQPLKIIRWKERY